MTGKKCKYLFKFNILCNYYSSNNNINQFNQEFIDFFRNYFINVEYTPDKDLTIRFFMSLLQMFIENNNNFDKCLINAWENEIKPYILQKFPISKDGLFAVNSDLEFLLNLIDSLKDQYDKKQIANNDTNNNNEEKNKNDEVNNKDNKDNEEEEEMNHKSSVIIINKKRRSTDHKMKKQNTTLSIKNISGNINNENKNKNKDDKLDNNNEEDIKILRKKNMSRINKFLLEIIKQNIVPPKRTNSMINLRPHSQTIDSKTTCESSIIEDNTNINLNINKLTSNKNIDKINQKDSNNNSDKKQKPIYGNIFMSGEETTPGNMKKIKGHLRSNSLNLLSEMRPIYKDEEEDEHTIVYKLPEKKLTFILADIFLKKIIFDDFIKNNILLTYHFCQQCFSFVNKEIFFRKIFHCYKYYKDNIPKEKLRNLIDFVNLLIIEMFDYCQKINLHDAHVVHIKKFYNELITDFTKIENINKGENQNNINNEHDNNNLEFQIENIDYSKNEEKIENNSNYNYKVDKKNLINKNLNIEIKNINIFVYKEKEEKKEDKEEVEIKNKIKTDDDIHMIGKSLTFRTPSLPNARSFFTPSPNKSSLKKFQEDKNNNTKTVSFKDEKIVLPWNIDENDEKKKEKEKKDEKNEEKETAEETKDEVKPDLVENIAQKEQKPKLFQIAKTLRKSHMMPLKKTLKDVIIEVDEDQKEKSDDEENKKNNKGNKDLYSDKSGTESQSESSSSSSSKSDSESDNENENDKIEKSSKSLKLSKKQSRDVKDKEEEKEKNEIIKNILAENNISEKLTTIEEEIMNDIQYILILLENDTEGEPSYQDIKEAKSHMKFYKSLQNILNKNKRMIILPSQRQKRYTKSYSSFFNIGSSYKSRDTLSKGYFCTIDWKTEEIGDELMRISKSLLNKIHPRELYRAVFLKKNKDKDSKNVVDCVNRFNRLTSFIIEDILSYNLPKERARIYEKWVAIADYCKTNKDYNDLIAIFSALNNYIITGLNLTLKEVKSKTNSLFRQISDFCTVEGNYKNIREDMNNCDKNGIIFIPYLGMLMRDINFFEESSKYINEYGCFNIEKIENINDIFEKYFRFKNVQQEKINKNPDLKFFEDLEDITEEKLEEIANKIEPDFTIEEIQKSGKRPTSIDEKYFEEYKYQQSNIMSVGTFSRRTISGILK